MATPAAVPAKPPTFHFKIRLVDSTGKAFEGKDYQLWWGGKMVQDGITDAAGVVEADLDDAYDKGILDLGDLDNGNFVARLTIPIEVVKPPPPYVPAPPVPAASSDATLSKRKKKGDIAKDVRTWTDENDPEPSPPARARDETTIQEWEDYDRKHDAWQRRQEEAQRQYARELKEAQAERDLREQNQDLMKSYRPKHSPPAEQSQTPEKPLSDPEVLEALREAIHEGNVLRWEAAWRLRNLGLLPGSGVPRFPLAGTDSSEALRALQRFAWRERIEGLEQIRMAGPPEQGMADILSALKKQHDG
jgi:hypothetical protein